MDNEEKMISEEEQFQNDLLRPALKAQNDLLVNVFKHYLLKHKVAFDRYSPEDQANYIEHTLRKDAQLRSYLIGLVIGKLSADDYQRFVVMETELNRRIITLLIQRLRNQLIP